MKKIFFLRGFCVVMASFFFSIHFSEAKYPKASSDSFEDDFEALDIIVESGTTLRVKSGATLLIVSGATFTLEGAFTVTNTITADPDAGNNNAFRVTDGTTNVFNVDSSGATQVVITSTTNGNNAFEVEDSANTTAFIVNTSTLSSTIANDLTITGTAGIPTITTGATNLQIFPAGGAANQKALKIRGDLTISGNLFNAAFEELQFGFKDMGLALETKERLIHQIQKDVQKVTKEVGTLREVVQTSSPLDLLDSDSSKTGLRKGMKSLVSGAESSADSLHTHTHFPLDVTFEKDVFSKGQLLTLNPLKGSKHSLVSFPVESLKPGLSMTGISQLQRGAMTIFLPSAYLELVAIDRANPLFVHITPQGECEGLYVSQLFEDRFTVQELRQGRSNVTFSWRVEATKKGFEDIETSWTLDEYKHTKRTKK